ncbi:MAG: serine--tRNA ligase [Candidatus Raymondbacteria bacterium RifOxyC12_full_50_8]|nr:MAG: serine--tRNA ligase [Candidatus Raymondbacteria bacterium RIFOXYA2_FULL_49_16]OGJ98157.1 MAG: serine--tRNA ligase [Candidatus Raymondbacteria bacterium RifOxyC12_full_50_8]OGP44973.1 MAG: serine--tRNA ligase [Candidatus Raymondbacteria bacterium RIFOXYB2_FULL_49_35]
MLDLKRVRENPDLVKKAVAEKNEKADIDAVCALDDERKRIIAEVETLKAERNKGSKEIGQAKREGKNTDTIQARMKENADRIKELDLRQTNVEKELRGHLLAIPNMPHESAPQGASAAGNVVVRTSGEVTQLPFEAKNHVELSETLDILDFKRGAKIAGSGFVVYKGAGALLERALINYFLDTNTAAGYTEIFPPFMVTPDCAEGTGQLPKSRDQMYYVNEDDLFLIPTAEVPVTNIYRDEVLNGKDLPINMTAYSACFRREAGSWGKDTRGFLRVHEFNKVEMVKFTEPEKSYEEHEKLVVNAEALLTGLGLPYRVLLLCRGDMSFAAAKCYDLEVYAQGEKRWLEVSSCSNFEDFQARRANIRYRNKEGKVQFVHTLNGSGLATARIIVAILENYQNEDGSITVPQVLRPYMHGMEKISK